MRWRWTPGRSSFAPLSADRVDRSGQTLRRSHRVLVVVLVLYFATTIPGVRSSGGYNVLIDGWLQNGVLVAAALVVYVRAWWVRPDRLAWALLGTGLFLYALGNILYFGYVQYLPTVPTPSIADAPWLCCYAFLYSGLVALVRHRIRVSDRTLLMDGLIATLGLCAVASIWLHFLLGTTSGGVLAEVVAMAYPVGDLIMLMVMVAAWGLLGARPDRGLTYLGIGMAFFAAADTIYAIRVATNTYRAGTMLDPLWAVAAVVIAAAALRPPIEAVAARIEGWAALVVPALFTLSSVVVLVFATVHRLPTVTTALATAALVAGLGRAAMTFREVRQLAVSRTEARTDELTGLGNRRHFKEVVGAQIAKLERGKRLAVLLIDLDRFKEINDSHGHSAGDALLIQVGERLSVYVRQEDILVRLGGDEYAAMLINVSVDEALEVAERMRTGLREAFTIADIVINIDASIGIAMCPDSATTVAGLLHCADTAMYEAKMHRVGSMVFDAGDDDGITARRQLLQELQTAIREGQLVLHYQQKFDLRTGKVDGVEALVRWNHPERGLLSPDKFIPSAERYGLMRNLTTAVLALALDQARAWRDSGFPTPVAVNVSASNLADPELPAQIEAMLDSRDLEGNALVVEVTETTLMNDTARALWVLHGLRALNVRISIDDYGTGYSSLARLRDLPINELKLDRSFVAALSSDTRTAAIVESTIQLAHSLGLRLVAEGIETAETLELLTEMGCDVGQGFHLGRPVPAADLAPVLARSVNDGAGRRTPGSIIPLPLGATNT
jgi:diguanylate cyclase (GGDEF)-like protein